MDLVISNARLATMAAGTPYGETHADAVAFRGGRIAWMGEAAAAPAAARHVDARGAWLTPALVDCHTHLVHGGNRARAAVAPSNTRWSYTSRTVTSPAGSITP